MSRPTKPDWLPDDTTGIETPSGSKQNTGWTSGEKPPFQYFNWFWNLVSRFLTIFDEAGYNVIIGSGDDDDYATFAAYLADSPTAGDRVLIKDDQVIAVATTVPSDITLKLQKGKKFTCAEDLAYVLVIEDNVTVEGDLLIDLTHTGTTSKVIDLNGSNIYIPNLIITNDTGTITDVVYVHSSSACNFVEGVFDRGSGAVTDVVDNSSSLLSNHVSIREDAADVIYHATPLSIAGGGTGAISADVALTNLGLTATASEINTVCDGSTAKNSHTHALADGASDVTATFAEINTACDGDTAKNNHTHTLATGASDVTASAAEVNATAHDGKYSSCGLMLGDATAGRKIRSVVLSGTSGGGTFTVETINEFNGNVYGSEELSKSEVGTNFNLSAGGGYLTIKIGNVVGLISVCWLSTTTSTDFVVGGTISSNNIVVGFRSNAGNELDMTSLTGATTVLLSYVTSA